MSNVMAIEWHENNLKNARLYETRIEEQIRALEIQLEDIRTRNDFLQKQIEQGKLKGKTAFDRDKFLKGARQ